MKLAKLPDRTPVKLTITLRPELATRLRDYADFYAEIYGSREEPAELVPFMLETFLDGDADFKRTSRTGGGKGTARLEANGARKSPQDRASEPEKTPRSTAGSRLKATISGPFGAENGHEGT